MTDFATALERFNEKWRSDENGCHVWSGAKTHEGYARFYYDGKMYLAYRWALKHLAGVDLIAGLTCDHLCNNPSCVNTDHLRQVTQKENNLAPHSNNLARLYSERTKCPNGHEYAGENLITLIRGKKTSRVCRECKRAYEREQKRAIYARRKAAQP